MDLLLEIKHFYDKLVENKILDKKPEFNDIDKIAEECFTENYTTIEKYLTPTLSQELYAELESSIDSIKEVVKNEKEKGSK